MKDLITIHNQTTINIPLDFQLIVYGLLGGVVLLLVGILLITWLDYREEVEETKTVTKLSLAIKKLIDNIPKNT